MKQRSGRIIRQGNENSNVYIYRYVTEETFDAYLYQLVEGKQKFASQIMTSKSPVRSAEDIDETALSYAEIKMLATGNPYIKEKMELDIQVQKLKLLKANFLSNKYNLEDKILKHYPQKIVAKESLIRGLEMDIETVKNNPKPKEDFVGIILNGQYYCNKKDGGLKLLSIIKGKKSISSPEIIGEYRGFQMELSYDHFQQIFTLNLKKHLSHYVELGDDVYGNIQRIDNTLESLEKRRSQNVELLNDLKKQIENARIEIKKPFEYEEELNKKMKRLNELNSEIELNNNSKGKSYYQVIDNEKAKDLLVKNGFDDFVAKDGKYIFKVAESEKKKVGELLNGNNNKICV